MKNTLFKKYKDTVLNIYSKDQLNHCQYDYVLVFKEQEETIKDNMLFIAYKDFHKREYLKLNIPAIRKPNKLLTYQEGMNILSRVKYGTLAISNDVPYCVGLTHFVVDGRLYFHTGYNGFKLKGMNKLACYHVIEDLGINGTLATQNYQSVNIYGQIKEIKENKRALIDALLQDLTPLHTKKITQQSVDHTLILELVIDHMDVKRHFH